jgi:hypothetical protein
MDALPEQKGLCYRMSVIGVKADSPQRREGRKGFALVFFVLVAVQLLFLSGEIIA